MAEQQSQRATEASTQQSNPETPRASSGSVTKPRMSAFLPFTPFTPYEVFAGGPFQLMRRMMEEMDRLVEAMKLWSPAIEVVRRDGSFVIRTELPGLGKENVKVELTPDGLLIQGERKEEHAEEQEGVLRSESRYGRFSPTIPLPDGANTEQANAQFNNGVLEVTIPVAEEKSQRRQIPIHEGQGTMAKAA